MGRAMTGNEDPSRLLPIAVFPSGTGSQMRWSRWRSVIPSAARRQPQCVTNSPAVEICRPIPLRRMQSLTPRCGAVCSDLVKAGLVRRHYQGYRVDHHNRGAQREAVYTITEAAACALVSQRA